TLPSCHSPYRTYSHVHYQHTAVRHLTPSFLLILPPPPTSTLFPYTTLFRSVRNPLPFLARVVQIEHRGDRIHAKPIDVVAVAPRSEEHTSELQSLRHLVCRLLLEKKKELLSYGVDCEYDLLSSESLVVRISH